MPATEKKSGGLVYRLILTAGAVVCCAIIYLLTWEITAYWNRNPQTAERAAHVTFEMVCTKNDLKPHDFTGSEKIAVVNVSYAFLWRMRSDPSKTIEVDISYLPYDVEYYLSTPLVRKPKKTELHR